MFLRNWCRPLFSLGSLNGKRGAVLLRARSVSCLGHLFSAYQRKGAQLELCLHDCHGRHPPVPVWPYSDSRRCHTVPGWLLVLLWSSLSPPGQGPANPTVMETCCSRLSRPVPGKQRSQALVCLSVPGLMTVPGLDWLRELLPTVLL